MLNEELKTKIGRLVDESMMTPANKKQLREKIQQDVDAFKVKLTNCRQAKSVRNH